MIDADAHRFKSDDDWQAREAKETTALIVGDIDFLAAPEPPPEVSPPFDEEAPRVYTFKEYVPPKPLDMPVLNPTTWKHVKGSHVGLGCQCGSCQVCRFWVAIRVEQAGRAHRESRSTGEKRRFPFSSVPQALEELQTHRETGYSSGSVAGSMEQLSNSGLIIRTDASTDTKATRSAERIAEIKKMIPTFADFATPRDTCVDILLARVVGRLVHGVTKGVPHSKREPIQEEDIAAHHGITTAEVRRIARHGREQVTIEMVARELAPMPREPSERRITAVARRRLELETRTA